MLTPTMKKSLLRFLVWFGIPLCLTLPYLYHGFFVPGTIPSWTICLMVFGGLGYIHVLNTISLFAQLRTGCTPE